MLLATGASARMLLLVDILLDGSYFMVNTALIGAAPTDVLVDVAIWLPAIMLASMVLSLFQVRKLEKVEWVENPEMERSG